MAQWDPRSYGEKYLASRPMRLHFAGWETDTYRLQQNGWQLSAVENIFDDSMQIAFQHQEYRMRGITHRIRREYDMMMATGPNHVFDAPCHLATDFISHTHSLTPFDRFKPIDAEPQFMQMAQRMSENMIFAPNLARTQEIIVPDHSVDQLLDMMLNQQAGNRAELIRKRVRQQGERIDFNQRTHVHAQLVSIAA